MTQKRSQKISKSSQKHTKSNMEAARWLGVNYNTYKKWAKYYGVFEQHLNPTGVGIKKGWAYYRIKLDDIVEDKDFEQKVLENIRYCRKVVGKKFRVCLTII